MQKEKVKIQKRRYVEIWLLNFDRVEKFKQRMVHPVSHIFSNHLH